MATWSPNAPDNLCKCFFTFSLSKSTKRLTCSGGFLLHSQVVADGWTILQVAYRIDLYTAGVNGAAAIAGTSSSSVDVKLAQNQGKEVLTFT